MIREEHLYEAFDRVIDSVEPAVKELGYQRFLWQ